MLKPQSWIRVEKYYDLVMKMSWRNDNYDIPFQKNLIHLAPLKSPKDGGLG
jgi:hypothetical protein